MGQRYMQNITWKGTRLRVQTYNVMVGSSQMELRRCYRDANATPILMLPGFLEDAGVFFPPPTGGINSEAGLAPFLASQGYDVFIAELRGKGNGWPAINRNSRWGLHEAISEDIPAHLAMIDRLRPGAPQIWLGHGLSSLLLTAVYARNPILTVPVLGMVHIAAARRVSLDCRAKRMAYRLWATSAATSQIFSGYVSRAFTKNAARETSASLKQWKLWQHSAKWLDPVDDFDYSAALQQHHLPASFYIANHPQSLWGNAQDCRRWIDELGSHDARLMMISKSGGNLRNYSDRDLLQHPGSCEDHFQQMSDWLNEITVPNSARS